MTCAGCEETKRILEFISPRGSPVMLPHAWVPVPHREDCPAAKPVKVFGMDVWTYAEGRKP